jgi:hypothetical protein
MSHMSSGYQLSAVTGGVRPGDGGGAVVAPLRRVSTPCESCNPFFPVGGGQFS